MDELVVMKHAHRDVERFNELAATYDRHHLQGRLFEPVQKTVLELAAAEVPRPRAILDVGCGTGRLLRAARERFPEARLQGVDAAGEMVKQARSAAPGIGFVHGTAEQLPFAAHEFDLVFSTLTFHHWADQRRGISEVARVLSPAGHWVLADFVPHGAMRWVFRLIAAKRFHDRARLDALLAPGGLAVVAERRVPRVWGQITALAIAPAG